MLVIGVLGTQAAALSPATGSARGSVAPVAGTAVGTVVGTTVGTADGTAAGRADDGAPFFGGARFISAPSNDVGQNVGTSGATCTAGFAWRKDSHTYLVTAGHCLPRGTKKPWTWTFRTSDGRADLHTPIGPTVGTTVRPAGTVAVKGKLLGDLAMIRARSAPRLFVGGPNGTRSIAVVGQAPKLPRRGDAFCVSGSTTGTHCGWKVTDTNLRVRESGALIVGLTEGRLASGKGCIKKGDSGGAVYATSGGEAVSKGIVSGYAGNGCTIFFTPIQYATTAFGGSTAR